MQTADVDVTNPSVPVQQAGTPVTINLNKENGVYTVPAGKRLVIQYVNGIQVSEPGNYEAILG